ncbi:DUF4249 family protein [Ferruginibacter sp.]
MKSLAKIKNSNSVKFYIMPGLLFFILSLASCEKIVTVDLNTESPRLVIDASINWKKGTLGNLQTIKLTTTTGYYQNNIPVASGAIVTVTNSSNIVFNFTETPNTGNYICSNFIPRLNETYKLKVIYKGEIYTAEENLILTQSLIDVEQTNDLGLNNDEIGIKVNFKDTGNQRNFYLLRSDFSENPFPEYQILDDQFADGNKMSWLYSHKKLAQGKILNFTQFGVSENYNNYMRLLIGVSSGAGNGPFQVIPTKVRGNIINQSNTNNYALGFFRLSEMYELRYVVK